MEEILVKKGAVVIGIGGPTCTGKTELAKRLVAANPIASVLKVTDYVKGAVYKRDERGRIWEDWEDSRAYDLNAFYEDLKSAKS
jgi:uridine kinase